MFQNDAIFMHLSVYKNLSFGLEVNRVPSSEIGPKVRDMARLMRMSEHLEWPAAKLSVNELQHLAIGRSAILGPNIFLLDEPPAISTPRSGPRCGPRSSTFSGDCTRPWCTSPTTSSRR